MTHVHGFECYIEEEFGLILQTLVICEVNFCPQNIENSINSRNGIFQIKINKLHAFSFLSSYTGKICTALYFSTSNANLFIDRSWVPLLQSIAILCSVNNLSQWIVV